MTCDVEHNRLVVLPNHEADVEMADEDDDYDDLDGDDDMIVEEMD